MAPDINYGRVRKSILHLFPLERARFPRPSRLIRKSFTLLYFCKRSRSAFLLKRASLPADPIVKTLEEISSLLNIFIRQSADCLSPPRSYPLLRTSACTLGLCMYSSLQAERSSCIRIPAQRASSIPDVSRSESCVGRMLSFPSSSSLNECLPLNAQRQAAELLNYLSVTESAVRERAFHSSAPALP